MFLDNFTKNRKVVIFDSFIAHFFGLMFHKKNKNLYLFKFKKPTSLEIHTFFMLCPIYVYFFNDKKKLIEKTMMTPWKIYFPKRKFKYIIESFYDLQQYNELLTPNIKNKKR